MMTTGTWAGRTVTLHDREELDDDLGARSDQDLALAGLLGVVDVVEGIVEDGSADHLGGIVGWRFSDRRIGMRYLHNWESNVSLRAAKSRESALGDRSRRVLPLGC